MSQTSNDPASNYMAKGFFFALGFVPVFLVLSGFTYWISYKIIMNELSVQLDSAIHNTQTQQQQLRRNIMQQANPNTRQKPQSSAQISESSQLSSLEKQERDCNLAILRYSETNTPDDKKRVYALCPEK